MELPAESRVLDGLLYNVFKMVVKGSKSAILTCVMFPSYIQAVCVLVEHMNISRYDRITRSIFALDRLVWLRCRARSGPLRAIDQQNLPFVPDLGL